MKFEYSEMKKFALLVIISGLIMMLLTPPMNTPDENAHFLNSYAVSRLDFFPTYTEANNSIGRFYPKYILDFVDEYNTKYVGDYNKKYNFEEQYFASWWPVSDDEREEVFFSQATMSLNSFSYIFAAIGIAVARLFYVFWGHGFDTAFNLLIAGRMGNFIFYIITGLIAINRAPVLKRVLMVIMIMPTALFCCMSVSYDAVILPIMLLYTAEILYILNSEENINRRNIITIIMCAFFMFAVKGAVYSPFLLLLFSIPKNKFVDIKQYLKCIFYVVTSFIVSYIIPFIIYYLRCGRKLYTNPTISEQKQYLISKCYYFPKMLAKTISSYYDFYASSFVGKLGQLDTNYPIPFLSLLLLLFIIICIFEVLEAGVLPKKVKVMESIICIVVIVSMFIEMYISWTPLVEGIKGELITGIQGRYFYPLFTLSLFPFLNKPRKVERGEVYMRIRDVLFDTFIIFAPISSIFLLLIRFWV